MTRARARGDRALLVSAVLCATTLGVTAIALPLCVLEAGYGAAAVGYLGGLGAASQLATRLGLPWVLRRVPDRWLIRAACALLATSGLTLLVSTTPAAFVTSAVLLGQGRALFWTTSQVHVLRGDLGTRRRTLSYVQVMSAVGELIGPLVGGFLAELSTQAALWCWAGCGAAALAPTPLLARFGPLPKPAGRSTAPVWRYRDVRLGGAAVGVAGGWRALLSSLVPAVLADLGRPAGQVGVLVAVANATSVIGSLVGGRVPPRRIGAAIMAGVAMTGFGIGAVGLTAGVTLLSGATLAVSGLGSGLLLTLGTVLAAGAVPESRRGDVVVLTGLVRSVTLAVLPPGVAALVGLLTAPPALAVGGVVLLAPALLRPGRRPPDGEPRDGEPP